MLVCAGALCAQDFDQVEIQLIAQGLKYAEGPVWSLDGYLLFGDTGTNKLLKFLPGKGVEEAGLRPGGVSGNAYDADLRLYTCETHERRVIRQNKSGKVDVIAAKFEGKKFNAPNDIVVREDNHLWFTDPAFGSQQDSRDLDFYGVFHVTPKGEIEAIARWKTRPNGIALSPNGRILYVTDSDSRTVHAFDVDKNGRATNDRVLISKLSGVPGGVRTDSKGNVWVAAKGIAVYSSKGDLLHEIVMSEKPSNLAFGDPDYESLYVTAGGYVYRMRTGIKGALPYAP
jgi:gluconolactonase